MDEFLIALIAVIPAVLVGLGTYFTTRTRISEDKGARLFDDALELKDVYKEAYKEVADDMGSLKCEIDDLRDEVGRLIKEGEMWRQVAVEAYHHQDDADPPWWPSHEPKPS